MKKFFRVVAIVLAMIIACQSTQVQAARKNSTAQSPYQIKVNRVANCVTVYKLNKSGYVPVRSFACSVGKDIINTPLGDFKTSDYYDWRMMVDNSYAQYAVRFYRGILFHSVPYLLEDPSSLESDQFNLLGTAASLGCVRLCAMDAKWIYDNCPVGTQVIVYDDAANPGPIGKPEPYKTVFGTALSGWDPTDMRPENPWNAIRPSMYLRLDMGDGVLYMFEGSNEAELAEKYIGCKDYNGNDLTIDKYKVSINGNYDLNKSGVYKVWVTVVDENCAVAQNEYTLAVVQTPQQ